MKEEPVQPQGWPVRRIAVLGDLHVRPGVGLVALHRAEAFGAWLERVAGRVDAVVLNGDLFDLDRGPWPLAHARAHAEIVAALPQWCRVVDDGRWLRTVGNHDAWLGERRGWPRALELGVGGLRVRIEHGHRFDARIKQARRFASAVTWLAGRAERPELAPVLRSMRWMEEQLAEGGRGGGGTEARAASWLARAPVGLDVLVLGHTHRAVLRPVEGPRGGRWLVNPGACLDGVLRWAEVDGGSGSLCLHEARGGVESRVECVRASRG